MKIARVSQLKSRLNIRSKKKKLSERKSFDKVLDTCISFSNDRRVRITLWAFPFTHL